MRHRKSFNYLSRKRGHRKAMLSNMAASLIKHKRIKTTTAKAKALRMFIEPLITRSKDDSTHSRRIAFSYLQNKEAVSELFREISPKIADRPGGYTRILKTGSRLGDNADMCVIELVDYNENLLIAKSEAETKTSRRRRRGARKKALEAGQVEEKAEAEEKKVEEVEAKAEAKAEAEVEEKVEEVEEKVEAKAEAEEKKVEEVEEKVEEVEEKVEAEAEVEEKAEAEVEEKVEAEAEVEEKAEAKAEEKAEAEDEAEAEPGKEEETDDRKDKEG